MRKQTMLGDIDAVFEASKELRNAVERISRIADGVADDGIYNRLKTLVIGMDNERRDLAITGSILSTTMEGNHEKVRLLSTKRKRH